MQRLCERERNYGTERGKKRKRRPSSGIIWFLKTLGNDLLDEMMDDRSVHTGIYWRYLGCDSHAVQTDGGTECHSVTTSVFMAVRGF